MVRTVIKTLIVIMCFVFNIWLGIIVVFLMLTLKGSKK